MNAPTDALLRAAVGAGALPNVIAIAADRDGVRYEGAAGPRTPDDPAPVDAGSVVRIASMTKIVCTVAALQLRDRGALDLAAPVDAYCPDFAGLRVLDGFDGATPRLRPPAGRATVRHLMTHTSGLAYGYWNAGIARWTAGAGPVGTFDAPMVADPGTRFEYGISTDWLGRVVEAAAGQTLDAYLAEHVCTPLRMTATTFRRDDAGRVVPVHVRRDGRWTATDIDWERRPAHWPGGHGLYTTPRDFLRFQRMLLCGGTLDGAAVLGPASVREIFTDQLGGLTVPAVLPTTDPAWSGVFAPGPQRRWGWGLLLDTADRPGGRHAGSGGWAGIFNTSFWIDPAAGLTAAFYTQSLPFCDPAVLRVCADFERTLYATR